MAWNQLARLAEVNALDDWRFTEWFHGRSLAPMGMAGQSWNAAAFLLSDLASGVTAEIMYVDSGFNAVAGGMAGVGA